MKIVRYRQLVAGLGLSYLKKLNSKSRALKKKRVVFEQRRLRDHRQEASGGYFNGQLGVKTVPFEKCTKDVLINIFLQFLLTI